MYIHAHVYIHTYTFIYIHMYMSVHIHICTYIHTYIQRVHMHAHKHAWNDSAAATAREAQLDDKSSTLLPRSTQSTTFSTSNTRTSLYPFPETPIPLNLIPPLPTYPRAVHGPRKRSLNVRPDTACHSRVHNSGEAPCSFTIAPLRS